MNKLLASAPILKTLTPFILLLGFCVSCSQESSSSKNDNVQTYDFSTQSELDQAVEDFQVSCEGPCPESAGVLLIKDDTQLKTCSFSLVGPQTILTNRHCLPDSLAKVGASCKDAIQAVFKKNSGEKEIALCDQVISFPTEWNENKKGERDFTFLKLKTPVSRPPLRINTGGIQDKEVLTALTATPDKTLLRPASILISKTCTAHMNSLILPGYSNPLKPVIAVKGCHIVPGNSGSALVDKNGQIKAVVQSVFQTNSAAHNEGSMEITGLTKKALQVAVKGQFALGTNIACMQNEELHLTPSETACDSSETTISTDVKSLIDVDAMNRKISGFQEQADSSSEILKLEAKLTPPTPELAKAFGDIMNITVEPVCLKGSLKAIPWLSQYERKGVARAFNKYPEIGLAHFSQPFLRYYLDLDEDARMVIKEETFLYAVTWEIPVAKIAKDPAGQFSIFGTTTMPLNARASTIEIPKLYNLKLCKD